jgi:hypothetical protein
VATFATAFVTLGNDLDFLRVTLVVENQPGGGEEEPKAEGLVSDKKGND